MIGRLRKRVGIYRAHTVPDETGGHVTTWPFYKAVWADILTQALRQKPENGRAAITAHYKVVIRFDENFPERARLLWGERTLRIVAASDPDGRRERLHLICEEEQQ